MNELFVNIKVDREERPDVDAIYMDAVQAMTGRGGWPMTVFLTPDGRAVLRRHLLPEAAVPAAAGRDRRRVAQPPRRRRTRTSAPLRRGARPHRRTSSRPTTLPGDRVAEPGAAAARPRVRPRVGWVRRAPKFPSTMSLDLVLRRRTAAHRRRRTRGPCVATTRSTRWPVGRDVRPPRRRLRPLLGRPRWLVPHFEKMLYDQALLVRVYTHAALAARPSSA